MLQIPYYHIAELYTVWYKYKSFNQVTQMVHMLEAWLPQIAIILVFSNGMWNQKKQIQFLNEIIEVEKAACKLKVPLNQESYKSFKQTSDCLKCGVRVFYSLLFVLKLYFFWNELVLLSTLFYYMLCSSLMNTLVIVMLMLVKFQKKLFQTINENVSVILGKLDLDQSKVFSETDTFDLDNLLTLHIKLYATIKLFNDSFGLNCAAIFMYLIGIETCLIYVGPFMMLSVNEISDRFLWNGLADIFWFTPLFSLLITFSLECKKTQDEGVKIQKILGAKDFKKLTKKDDFLKENVSNLLFLPTKNNNLEIHLDPPNISASNAQEENILSCWILSN